MSKKRSTKKSVSKVSTSRKSQSKKKAVRSLAKVRSKKSASKSVKKNVLMSAKNNTKISKAAQNIVSRVLERTQRLEREDRTIEQKLSEVLRNQKALLAKDKFEIENQKKILGKESEILKKEDQELRGTRNVEDLEKKQLEELKKLEELEQEIEKHLEPHPLLKVGVRDVVRGSVGALAGIVLHYTFVYGVKVAENLTTLRATILFVLTFLIGFTFLYVTGFRKIQDKKILLFMPVRLIILYLVSLIMSILVLWFFFPNDFGYQFDESYKQVASVMLPALI